MEIIGHEDTADILFTGIILDELKDSGQLHYEWYKVKDIVSFIPQLHLNAYRPNHGFIINSMFACLKGRDYFIFEDASIQVELTKLAKYRSNSYKKWLKEFGDCKVKINPYYINDNEELLLLDIKAEENDFYEIITEGNSVGYYVKRYERSLENRQQAIIIHGTRCFACDLNFKEKYGELGENFIEIHHVKPLSTLEEEIKVDPKTDLVPLCANCHRMIHRKKNEVLSIEELKEIIKQNNI